MRGFRSDLPKHMIPEGFLSDGQNVVSRNGVLLVRPGFSLLDPQSAATDRVMGGVYYRDNTQSDHVVIGTRTKFHHFDGTTWSDITGSALTGSASNQVRFTVFPFSATTRVISVNDIDVPQVYNGSGTFGALGGSPPIAKCVTTTFQRIILGNVTVSGTRRASSIWISAFQDPTTWLAANQADLPDTGDVIVEVKALSNQTFAIYKERSQWVGFGAGNIFPFTFSLQSQQPGPVSPGSVVQVEEVHYYIGLDGGIFRFDGTRTLPIGNRVRRLIQSDLDLTNMAQTHGFYDPTNREIWWFWPSSNRVDGFDGLVYRLSYDDVPDAFSPLQAYGKLLTASFPWRVLTSVTWSPGLSSFVWNGSSFNSTYPTWQSFGVTNQFGTLVADSVGKTYSFNKQGGDDTLGITAYWEYPLRPLSGVGENARIDVIESNFKQAGSSITVSIIAVTSDALEDEGTPATAQSVDISSASKLRATYYDLQARYASVKHFIQNAVSDVEYRGSVLFVYKREES